MSRLEALPGWVWDVLEAQWEEGFAELLAFVEREGHARPPLRFKAENNFTLDKAFISRLPPDDALFVAEFIDELNHELNGGLRFENPVQSLEPLSRRNQVGLQAKGILEMALRLEQFCPVGMVQHDNFLAFPVGADRRIVFCLDCKIKLLFRILQHIRIAVQCAGDVTPEQQQIHPFAADSKAVPANIIDRDLMLDGTYGMIGCQRFPTGAQAGVKFGFYLALEAADKFKGVV